MVTTNYTAQTSAIDRVNITTAGDQGNPRLVSLADGSGVAFFTSDDDQLLARRLDVNGRPVGPEIPISFAMGSTNDHSEVVLANGNILVSWADGYGDIRARVYSPDLQPIGATLTLFDGTSANGYTAIELAVTATGFAAVAEYNYPVTGSSDHDIHVRTFTSTGVLENSNSISPTAYDTQPDIAVLTNGDIVVTFSRNISGDIDSYYAIYSPALVARGSPIAASSASYSRGAEVTATPDHGFVITLSETTSLGGSWVFVAVQNRSQTGALLDTDMSSTGGDVAKGTVAGPNGAVATYIQQADYDGVIQVLTPNGRLVDFYLGPPNTMEQLGGSITWINPYTVQVAYTTTTGTAGSDGDGLAAVTARYQLVRTSTSFGASEAMTGDDFIDVMLGNGGNDTMNGAGGPDTMRGGAGSDVYYVDNWGDLVDEQSPGSDGWDTVYSSIGYVLPNEVEALLLLAGATTATGNGLNNYLAGNAGNNGLDGSFGADTMAGGDGDDSYIVDNAGDLVDEFTSGSGWDTVYSSIDYALGPNIEALVLLGSLKLDGTGNGLGNFIVGNIAANGLKGGGGNDTVMGGGGKDSIDGGSGRDIADYSDKTLGISVTLNGSKTVTVKVGGRSEDKLKSVEGITGSIRADNITGDNKANILNGGLGKDSLKGGGGADRFVFNALGPANADKIADFKHNTDKIALEDWVFAAIGPVLDKGEFYARAGARKAHDADDRIVYDKSTGKLYYDADGKDGAAAIHVATLSTKPSLDHGDFIIV